MDSLIIEELYLLDKQDIDLIENRTRLKVLNGIKVLVYFLPFVLNNIYKALNENLKEKEILIIGDDEELTKEVIESLHKSIRFVTLAGDYEDSIEDISNYILEKTGLSIFYSKKIHKILRNYSIIINLKDKNCIDIDKLRTKAIIFDFGIRNTFTELGNIRKRKAVIEDFMFKASDLNIKENQWMKELTPSYIYEYFYPLKVIEPEALVVNKELYNFEDFRDYQLGKKTVST